MLGHLHMEGLVNVPIQHHPTGEINSNRYGWFGDVKPIPTPVLSGQTCVERIAPYGGYTSGEAYYTNQVKTLGLMIYLPYI